MSFKSTLWEKRTLITRSPRFARLGSAGLEAVSWLARHNPLQRFSASVRNARYLNAGCGYKPRAGFLNLDYHWHPGIQLVWDMKRRLPIGAKSLKGIFSEHCLEHIPLAVIRGRVLPEFLRVLRTGATLRIIVPDAGLWCALYVQSLTNSAVGFPHPEWGLPLPMMHVNQCFRGFGHEYAYDFDTIRLLLDEAGFQAITRCDFHAGRDSTLFLDSPERRIGSLYVEAIAP